MKCPSCLQNNDRVLETRVLHEAEITRRRRECLDCGKRFTSHERIEEQAIMTLKRDGTQELFNGQKIIEGLVRAFGKRSFAREQIESIVEIIEKNLREQKILQIASSEIGELVLDQLKLVDEVAYIRFASVYRKFSSAFEFTQVVQSVFIIHGGVHEKEAARNI